MARYIDADKLEEKISHITVTVMCGRLYGKTLFDKALKSYRKEVLKRIEDAPTVDVVPKSEVDSYRKQVDELEDELASTYDKLENAKQEVAREIFEEIEKLLHSLETPINEYWVLLPNDLAELKKKYYDDLNKEEKL